MTALPSTARPTRAAFLSGGGLSVLAVLTACSADADTASDPGQDADTRAEVGTQYPLTLTTPYGETVLEAVPQRIAVVGGSGDLEAAVSLGLAPVITPWTVEDMGWLVPYEEALADAEPIGAWDDPFPYETIAAAQPDLIIAQTLTGMADHYDRLAEIAPVLGREVEEEYGETDKDWRALVRGIARAVDRDDAAEEVISETEAHIEDVAARHPEYRDRTICLLINRGQEFGIEMLNLEGTTTEELLTELGFASHPHAAEVTESLSLENIGLADADVLVIHQHGGEDEPEVAAEWLESSELYQRLEAVQDDAVGFTDGESIYGWNLAWGLSWPDPLNLRYIVDELETVLEGVLES